MNNYVGIIEKDGKKIYTSTTAIVRHDAIVKLSNHYNVPQKNVISCKKTK
jgi:hypothetical protein